MTDCIVTSSFMGAVNLLLKELPAASTHKCFGIHKSCIILYLIYDGTNDVEYKLNHRTILDGSVYNMYLVISRCNFGAMYYKD